MPHLIKIIYIVPEVYIAGGLGRTLAIKANFLAEEGNYKVFIVTTNQRGKAPFYTFSPKITLIHLDLNYFEIENKNPLKKALGIYRQNKIFKKKIASVIENVQPDFLITPFYHYLSVLVSVKDKSKKILELHFPKERLFKYTDSFFKNCIQKLYGVIQWHYIKKYDAIVTLTKSDTIGWGKIKVVAIPNALPVQIEESSSLREKKVIAVGRLDAQKAFNLLLSAWGIVVKKCQDWTLNIYGDGDDYDKLSKQIIEEKIENSAFINKPVRDIYSKYLESSIFVLSSVHEGFGMVLIEAMSCGVPCVSFNCPHGPADIIRHEEDGLLVSERDIEALANGILYLIENEDIRKDMGRKAKQNVNRFSQENIMRIWMDFFDELLYGQPTK
ncbi:MAG: glycosyltransferase family 4 protein [Bacteroidales bacterium]|nr:glycosyltransferase family 4 protein [Bacteroidales bacterium]